MNNIKEEIEKIFDLLEQQNRIKYFRKDTRIKLVDAFSQIEYSPYKYLGYSRAESLSKLMNRIIINCDKPYAVEWRNWFLSLNNKFLCKSCESVLDLSEIVAAKDRFQCKTCNAKKTKDRNKTHRQFLYDYLSNNPCVDCGEDNPILLEFDHRDPSTKSFNLASGKSFAFDKILKEIDKCDVVCANCHRKRTSIQQNWYKDLI